MHNVLEATQDALEYLNEEEFMARNSDLFSKFALVDFGKLLEEIGTEGLSQNVKQQPINGSKVLRVRPVQIPFRTDWKYDVKKEILY